MYRFIKFSCQRMQANKLPILPKVYGEAQHSVPLCYIEVNINSELHKLTVNNAHEYEDSIREFCGHHQVLWQDCERIKAYYNEKCRGAREDGPAVEDDTLRVRPIQGTSGSSSDDNENGNNDDGLPSIDYATPEGPELTIFYKEQTLRLARFRGETLDAAVHRLCKSSRMLDIECVQVRDAFANLQCQSMGHCTTGDLQQITQEHISSFDLLKSVWRQVSGWLKILAPYVMLLAGIVLVGLQRPA